MATRWTTSAAPTPTSSPAPTRRHKSTDRSSNGRPEGAENSGSYTFGPAEAEVLVPDVPGDDTDGELDRDGTDTFGGTDTNTVVGPSTEA
jgi:hypothetical protein